MLAFFAKNWVLLWLVFILLFLRWFHIVSAAREREVSEAVPCSDQPQTALHPLVLLYLKALGMKTEPEV